MKKKTVVEIQRQRISLIVRAQASILRAEYLNEVLPVALDAFDKRVQTGEPTEVKPIDLTALIEEAAKQVAGG